MKNFEKEAVEKAFKSLNEFLNSLNLEVDNHCEFVSVIIKIDTREVVAELHDTNSITWIEE